MRACIYAGMRVCGHAYMRVCGYAGMRACRYAGIAGIAGMRACIYAGIAGIAGMRVCRYAGMRVLRYMDFSIWRARSTKQRGHYAKVGDREGMLFSFLTFTYYFFLLDRSKGPYRITLDPF